MNLTEGFNDAQKAALKLALETSFLLFVRFFFKAREGTKYQVNYHHKAIVDALMRCYTHDINRLVINIPPRYGKTELVVVMFIAWSLARNPRCKFIHLSYSDELALYNSTQVRELIESDEFQEFWPISLKASAKAKSLWLTEQGGGLKAGAAGGAVTGFGAGLGDDSEGFGGAIIIDDPLKPDDGESEVERKKVNRRLNSTIKSRVNSRETPIIMVMQRLHDDDPSGFVINGGTGEEWEHLKIPARMPDGKPLWEFRHTDEDLQAIQRADKYVYAGQYQQDPVPDDGDYFKAEHARYYDTLPAHLNFYGASDYAAEEDEGDFTEHGIFGVCPQGNIYVVDWWSGQTPSDVWVDEQINLIKKYSPIFWAGETGPIKSAVLPWLKKRMRDRKTFTSLKWFPHNVANYKRKGARGFQAVWEQGLVYLPQDKPWAADLLAQLTRFPRGTLDDKVDVCSLFAKMLDKVWEQLEPKPEEEMTELPVNEIRIEELLPKQSVVW